MALDAAAEAAVSCTGLQERALGDGRLEVIANLKNGGTTPVHVRVQCAFLDGQGLPVETEAPWQPLDISPDSTEVMRFTAPVLAAKRYVIRVRSARAEPRTYFLGGGVRRERHRALAAASISFTAASIAALSAAPFPPHGPCRPRNLSSCRPGA